MTLLVLPALVGEADGSVVLRLAGVLLLARLLPLGDDVAHLSGEVCSKRKTTLLKCQQDDQADLDVPQQAVLQLLAAGVVGVQTEARRLPHGRLLVETALELLHCGGSVEAHHLEREQRPRSPLASRTWS